MTAPSVPDDASEDVPTDGSASGPVVRAPRDPEGEHRRGMDRVKLKFAFWLVGCSVGLAVILSVLDFAVTATDGELDAVIDVLKLIATTALGFIFGRSLGNGEK